MKHQNTEPENLIFWHTPCFLIYDSPEFREYPMHWHNAVEILMPTENVFPVVCGSTEYLLKEGDILVIPAGELHNLKAQRGKRIIMLCDNAMLKDNPALSEINMLLSRPLWLKNDSSKAYVNELGEIIYGMMKLYNDQPPFGEILLYQKLLELFVRIAEHESRDRSKNKSIQNIETVRKYIDRYYTMPITLDMTAEAAGYSKYYLSRVLSGNGTSFTDLLNERRIKAAEILLHDENYPVTQIAMDVGFASITTFNRAFRSIKGCTPTQFRAMYRAENIL